MFWVCFPAANENPKPIAIEIAMNPKKLKKIKEKLKNNAPSSTLFDSIQFTKNLETAYRKIYDRNQKDLEPENIYIEMSK